MSISPTSIACEVCREVSSEDNVHVRRTRDFPPHQRHRCLFNRPHRINILTFLAPHSHSVTSHLSP